MALTCVTKPADGFRHVCVKATFTGVTLGAVRPGLGHIVSVQAQNLTSENDNAKCDITTDPSEVNVSGVTSNDVVLFDIWGY